MGREFAVLRGIGLGAGLMYFFDPVLGRRRQAWLRDKFLRLSHQFSRAFDMTARDLGHRVQGLAAETKGMLSLETVGDDVLVNRIRSKIGHYVSHPRALHIESHAGTVTLSGPVLQREVSGLLWAIARVRGVKDVVNYLEAHEHPGDIPELQGEGRRGASCLHSEWSPPARLLACSVGAVLLSNWLARRRPLDSALGVAGAGLLLRGLTNLELGRALQRTGSTRHVEYPQALAADLPSRTTPRRWESEF